MASVSAFICPGSAQQLVEVAPGFQAPACSTGVGSWQQIELVEPFDPAQLSGEELSGAFGAGFITLGTGLVIAWAARMVVDAIRGTGP